MHNNNVIFVYYFVFSFKDGHKIPEHTERFQIIREHSDRGFYELVIPDVKHSDAGVYKCVASNKFGEASTEATVTVTGNLFYCGSINKTNNLFCLQTPKSSLTIFLKMKYCHREKNQAFHGRKMVNRLNRKKDLEFCLAMMKIP